MSRLQKLKLENIKKANALLDKGHTTKYPPQDIKLKPSGNVTQNPQSFTNKMNNLKEDINEQNVATSNGSGFSQKQGSSNALNKFNKRQEFREDEDLGGMTSDPRIMAREYGNTPESPEAKAAEQIFQLFDHKIGEWSISPDHRVTQETQKYLNDWKEDVKSQLEVIINTVVSEYGEQTIDDELDAELTDSPIKRAQSMLGI